MKHLHFDVELNGFYGAYWACADGSDCAVITMIGDDKPEADAFKKLFHDFVHLLSDWSICF